MFENNIPEVQPIIKKGSACHEGNKHVTFSLGYQDSSFITGNNSISVGIICDGCSSSLSGYSKNQVGAILGAEIIAQLLFKKIKKQDSINNVFHILLNESIFECRAIFKNLIRRIKKISSQFDRQKFIADKLTFSFLGVVTWNNNYWIFGLGNGCYGIDNEHFILPDEQLYFSNYLFYPEPTTHSTIYAAGLLESVKNIWIASDGFEKYVDQGTFTPNLENFFNDERTCNINAEGDDETVKSFRSNILNKNRNLFSDDTTIIIFKILKGIMV